MPRTCTACSARSGGSTGAQQMQGRHCAGLLLPQRAYRELGLRCCKFVCYRDPLHATPRQRPSTLVRLLDALRRFNRVPRPGQAPVRVSPVALALVLPRHALGCLLAGQPAVPPDADTPTLTSAAIESTSHFEHIAKALTLRS